MADPTPIVVSGGGSRFGETLLILAALALAAWLIFRRKAPPENVVDPEPVIARPPAVPTTTGAGSAPERRPSSRVSRTAPAPTEIPASGATVLASIQRPQPVTVPQGATASAGANTTPTAGATFKPHPNTPASIFAPMAGPVVGLKPPAIGVPTTMVLKPAPLTPPAYAPPPAPPPLVTSVAVKPGLASSGLFGGSSSNKFGTLTSALGSR